MFLRPSLLNPGFSKTIVTIKHVILLSCVTVHLSWSCYAWQSTCLELSWQSTCLELSWQSTCLELNWQSTCLELSWSCYGRQSTCLEAAMVGSLHVMKLPWIKPHLSWNCLAWQCSLDFRVQLLATDLTHLYKYLLLFFSFSSRFLIMAFRYH